MADEETMGKLSTTRVLMIGLAILFALGVACRGQEIDLVDDSESRPTEEPALAEEMVASPAGTIPAGPLIQPADLVYQGAFRLPEGPEEIGWAYSGAAMTVYPDGDPGGPADSFPGSIYGTGHDWNQYVSEISIPVPIISPDKDPNALNTATTLQDFSNIRGDLFDHLEFEIPRAGLAYEASRDKLHFCWGQHMQQGATWPTHGWIDRDLSDPQPAGAWRIGEQV